MAINGNSNTQTHTNSVTHFPIDPPAFVDVAQVFCHWTLKIHSGHDDHLKDSCSTHKTHSQSYCYQYKLQHICLINANGKYICSVIFVSWLFNCLFDCLFYNKMISRQKTWSSKEANPKLHLDQTLCFLLVFFHLFFSFGSAHCKLYCIWGTCLSHLMACLMLHCYH